MTVNISNPASSGPAGNHFEGQVGAHYLLSLLTGTEPRGLPGTTIDRIEFQRAAEGRPLDDVIVHAHDARGIPSVLEIQVKRSIAFSPTDSIFRAVVAQIVEASKRPDFWTTRYELAIATARTSRKIDGAYQDVLTWARQLGDAATFTARIKRPNSANDDMRTFVRTFKSHLHNAGSPDDDETVWRLLRKLQILVFDFTAQGSASEELAKERAVRALHQDEATRAGDLWTTLVELALQIAKNGGDRTRDRLIEDLRTQSFRLAGDRRYLSARTLLTEASRHALADISDRIGEITLSRHERVAAVHTALDNGRYVEIRGDAGVGKSGVLRHFAAQMAAEGSIIVLSPHRTEPKGWSAMRLVLGFIGTAHDLLTDLAADGGAVLFVDNLDFFDDDEQKTVIDLVREAAGVPGFAVIVTARRNFGMDEPTWLPSDALDRLGRAEPIMIGELSDIEIDEVRESAPTLASILSNTHPARAVTRNLFRLARLASRPGDVTTLRTEVDMAEQWWQTADGKLDADHRERARLLRALAEAAIDRADALEVGMHPARVVDDLVTSETLRDLGNDRVAFRHDVLREWAIGNLLHSVPEMIERLPLGRPASAALARGVELAARMALERTTDGARWQSLIERLSHQSAHGSWRRAALLAFVRSEISDQLLTRLASLLLADDGSLLRDLIRFVMAVDVEPAAKVYAALGVDPAMIPSSIHVPSGMSWPRLIRWLLKLGEGVPVSAIPDVADLYFAWSTPMMGHDPLTPELLPWLFRWLTEIEAARHVANFRDLREPFSGVIDRNRIDSLESTLRTGFLLCCHRTPELAKDYLRLLSQRPGADTIVRSILKFRGSLAKPAPAELAEFTANALMAKPQRPRRGYHDEPREPFTHYDLDFLPPSPAQGPFYELLTNAPPHGLSLIRRLAAHAILFYSGGKDHGTNAFTIPFPDGDRVFPWTQSYIWSREEARFNCVTSGLMALEAWGHNRIEAGEPFETVLADVLGPPGSAAAYLLVAVDLVLSHWPTSQAAAVPFVACPELLCLDRLRMGRDKFQYPDVFGVYAEERKRAGLVTLDSLKKRPSRGVNLDRLLGHYAVYGPPELREKVITLLQQATGRLGPPNPQSGFGDPPFMAVHALNLVDLRNWQQVTVESADGPPVGSYEYISPETERRHLAQLQAAAQPRLADANMQAAIELALDDPTRSSPEFAAVAVEWAQREPAPSNTSQAEEDDDENKDEDRLRNQAVVITAMMVMRDGDASLRAKHETWVRGVFAQALQTKADPVHRFRSGLHYNPIATAFVGMSYGLKDRATPEDIRVLLEVVTRDEPSAAHGFGTVATLLATIDERIPCAVLRCAFAACVRPSRGWGIPDETVAVRLQQVQERVQSTLDAEMAWLVNERVEPDWPVFPEEVPRLRRGFRFLGGRVQRDEPSQPRPLPDEYFDHQAAAVWLSQCSSLVDVVKRPWLREMVRTYAHWTAGANGAGLDKESDVDREPIEWNNAYFHLLVQCLSGLAFPEIEQLALEPMKSFPDRSFFDVLPQFLRNVDAVYFNHRSIEKSVAISIRSMLANRLMTSSGWKQIRGSRTASIESHLGPAVAVLFFNDHGFAQQPTCYLVTVSMGRLAPFLPVLEQLVESGPSHFVAVVTLNLLEVSPKSDHLRFMITAAKTWMQSYLNDTEFWVEYGIGRRVSVWIEEVYRQEPALLDTNDAVRSDVDRLLAALVNLGIPEARRLEKALNKE